MSNDDEDLPFGLYERLVTAGLKARLLDFDSATTRIVTEELDAAEVHATLARHIANLVAGVLRALPQEDRTASQAELANQISSRPAASRSSFTMPPQARPRMASRSSACQVSSWRTIRAAR